MKKQRANRAPKRLPWQKSFFLALVVALVFWAIDWFSHELGGSETFFYHSSKLANAFIVSFIVFHFFWHKLRESWQARAVGSVFMGLYISLYYLLASYSGFVQEYLGIIALRSPPTFFFQSPYWWGPAHMLCYFIALNIGVLMERTVKNEQ